MSSDFNFAAKRYELVDPLGSTASGQKLLHCIAQDVDAPPQIRNIVRLIMCYKKGSSPTSSPPRNISHYDTQMLKQICSDSYVNGVDSCGYTPMDLAIEFETKSVIHLLIVCGSKVNVAERAFELRKPIAMEVGLAYQMDPMKIAALFAKAIDAVDGSDEMRVIFMELSKAAHRNLPWPSGIIGKVYAQDQMFPRDFLQKWPDFDKLPRAMPAYLLQGPPPPPPPRPRPQQQHPLISRLIMAQQQALQAVQAAPPTAVPAPPPQVVYVPITPPENIGFPELLSAISENNAWMLNLYKASESIQKYFKNPLEGWKFFAKIVEAMPPEPSDELKQSINEIAMLMMRHKSDSIDLHSELFKYSDNAMIIEMLCAPVPTSEQVLLAIEHNRINSLRFFSKTYKEAFKVIPPYIDAAYMHMSKDVYVFLRECTPEYNVPMYIDEKYTRLSYLIAHGPEKLPEIKFVVENCGVDINEVYNGKAAIEYAYFHPQIFEYLFLKGAKIVKTEEIILKAISFIDLVPLLEKGLAEVIRLIDQMGKMEISEMKKEALARKARTMNLFSIAKALEFSLTH